MCYFNRNGETWGNRKDFDVLLIREPEQSAAGISLLPNPASDQISIQRTGDWALQTGTLQVYELSGREVMRHSLPQSSQSNIDIQTLKAGIYLVRVVLDNSQAHMQK